MKSVGELLGITTRQQYDRSVHYNRGIHHNDLVGVEIEFEKGNRFMESEGIWARWDMHEDGSLRDYGRELVFSQPWGGVAAEEALVLVMDSFDRCSFSHRTSVHVHVDVRDITSPALYRYMLLYVVLEEVLFNMCGAHRAKNNFCVATYHANGMLSRMGKLNPKRFIRSLLSSETAAYRYSGMNLDSVRKFGSLEFRGHEGTGDVSRIATWINVLTHMKHYAVKTRNMESILTMASTDGAGTLLRECFPQELYEQLVMGMDDLEGALLRGARRAQDVIIARELDTANAALLAGIMEQVAPPEPRPVRQQVGVFRDLYTPSQITATEILRRERERERPTTITSYVDNPFENQPWHEEQ